MLLFSYQLVFVPHAFKNMMLASYFCQLTRSEEKDAKRGSPNLPFPHNAIFPIKAAIVHFFPQNVFFHIVMWLSDFVCAADALQWSG